MNKLDQTLAMKGLILLCEKTTQRLRDFKLPILPEKAFSPASLAKAYLEAMGISPFLEKNPDFQSEILGYIMTTYYGGRSEVRIRKRPTRVRYMDFTSMYPTVFSLMQLWKFLTAETIEWHDTTEEVRRLVNTISLDKFTQKDLWQLFPVIVQLEPDGNVLPVRGHYGDRYVWNIGLNLLTSKTPLWYALPDVLASRLLTGKSPKIQHAIAFKPVGIQSGLTSIEIGGHAVTPETDLIKEIIELRRTKQIERDKWPHESLQYKRLDTIQNELKIVANAMSYGIFMEVNTEDLKTPETVDAYGLSHFRRKVKKKETFGRFFHPIIGTLLTSGARLMLAMAECRLERYGTYYAFCDTDSMAVKPSKALSLMKFFQPLSPYSFADLLFKLEDVNREDGQLRELWFYGISAKRYVLFTLDNENPIPTEDGWSSHGLGHLEIENKKEWVKRFWTHILQLDRGKISSEEFLEEYKGEYAVAKFAVTTTQLYKRVKALNTGQSIEKQIKPYNFVLVGSPTMLNEEGDPIFPLTSFTKKYGLAPFQDFIDAHTWKLHKEGTHHYWKTLDEMAGDYINHPESKFRNGNRKGKLQRRCLIATGTKHIGKEADEIEETEILGVSKDTYVKYS